jgi:DNA-binding MarR family transcriptional regulator
MTSPNHPVRPAIGRTLAAYEAFEQRLMAVHAPEFTAFDLTMAQAKLLYVVTVAGDLSMSEIAGRLGVTTSTASGAVEHLVSVGLLSRVDDPANRRQVRVSVTPHGRDALEQMRELTVRQLQELLNPLDDAQLDVVEHAIRILTDAIAVPGTVATPVTGGHS